MDTETEQFRDAENFFEVVNEEIDLQDQPLARTEGRFATPERNPRTKRAEQPMASHRDVKSRRVAVDVTAIDNDGMVDDGVEQLSPQASWYRDTNADRLSAPVDMPVEIQDGMDTTADNAMDLLDEVDRRILASLIMSVDITEVYSPERVNKVARKFGLVPGASMDLTNGYDFTKAED